MSINDSEPSFLDLSESQKRQYIDAETVFEATLQARKAAKEVRGSMIWKTVSGKTYLVRTNVRGAQTSLGARNDGAEQMYRNFMEKKERTSARVKSLEAQLTQHKRMNRALRLGRVPNVVVDILRQLDKADVGQHFMVVGTHALYAYEAAAGVRILERAMATQDVDLLFDTRQRLAFSVSMEYSRESMIGLIRKVDPTFEMVPTEKCTLRNDKGFEIDFVRRMAKSEDPHPMRMTEDENDVWPVQIEFGEKLLSARHFNQMVVATSGEMALMRTIHPLDFSRTKAQLAESPRRDPLKVSKDRMQSEIVKQLVDELLPHLRDATE